MFCNVCLALTMVLLASKALACSPSYPLAIDLNNYYAGADQLTGSALKAALHQIIDDQPNLGYSCVWDILRAADEDPSNSANVIGFYTRRSIAKADRDYGQNTPDAWNREHIWAKSHGGLSGNQAAHNDAHHLRATDKSVNADRASKDFAEGGMSHWECTGCAFTASTWEPPNEVKGDTARMMFYMATRYEGDDNVPDLELVDQVGTSGALFGDLCDLVQWHVDDPVSNAERQRNDIVYSFQGNRNPYIDRPDDAIKIWGAQCGVALPPTQHDSDEDIPFLPAWALWALGASLMGFKFWQGPRRQN